MLGISSHKVEELLRRAEERTRHMDVRKGRESKPGCINYKAFLGEFVLG